MDNQLLINDFLCMPLSMALLVIGLYMMFTAIRIFREQEEIGMKIIAGVTCGILFFVGVLVSVMAVLLIVSGISGMPIYESVFLM